MSRRNPPRIAARLGSHELGGEALEQVAAADRARYLARRLELAPLPPPEARSTTTEREWQGQVLRVAATLGWWSYHPHLSRWSERGWPDLSLLHEGLGRALWIECKTDTGHLSESQVAVIDRMLACGLAVHVCRPAHGLEHVGQLLYRGTLHSQG